MSTDNDYKYILDSLTQVQIGARYSYRELADNPDVSYKFRCIIKQVMLQEVDAGTTLESHLYYLSPEDETCRVLGLIRAKIRVYVPVSRRRRGREETIYQERTLTPAELVCLSPEQKKAMGLVIFELQLSKPALGSYAI